MLKRSILLGIIGTFIISNITLASPHVHIDQSEVQADFNYQFSKNKETYNGNGWNEKRNVNGHVTDYSVSIGLKNNYTMSVGVNNYRYNFFNDINNQKTKPSIDSFNLNVQKQLTDNFAVFIGTKHTSGAWTYYKSTFTPATLKTDNNSKNTAIIGFIAEKKLANQLDAYVKASVGQDFNEYKIGFSHNNLNVGYGYTKYQNIHNREFSTFPTIVNSLDLVTKGFYFNLEHKF